jgi:FtsP/CotA-like multicopper oxidase with cupredoxin domain
MVDGWKEFHLVADPVRFEIVPGRVVDACGYNECVPDPTLEVNQGDKVRVIFENKLPEPCVVHWHGFEVRWRWMDPWALDKTRCRPAGSSFTNGNSTSTLVVAWQRAVEIEGFLLMHESGD